MKQKKIKTSDLVYLSEFSPALILLQNQNAYFSLVFGNLSTDDTLVWITNNCHRKNSVEQLLEMTLILSVGPPS